MCTLNKKVCLNNLAKREHCFACPYKTRQLIGVFNIQRKKKETKKNGPMDGCKWLFILLRL